MPTRRPRSTPHVTARPDPGHPDAEGLPADRPRGVVRRIAGGFISFGLVAVIFLALIPKLSHSGDLGDAAALITPWAVFVCIVLGVANLATNLPPLAITLPGLRYRQAAVTNTASAALSNTVPEGGAIATGLNFAMLRSWGFDLSRITLSFMVTGIWTNLVRYGLLAIALVVMAATGQGGPGLLLVALAVAVIMALAVAIFALLLSRESFARWLGRLMGRLMAPFLRLFRRPPVDDMDEQLVDFRRQSLVLLATRWPKLTLAMIVSQLSACLVLGVALRLVGVDQSVVSWAHVVVAFGLMSLASLIAPTPGGLGVAELALVAVLSRGVPDSYSTAIVAGVALFRGATWLLPIPLGAGSYLFWRYNHTWRVAPGHRDGAAAATA